MAEIGHSKNRDYGINLKVANSLDIALDDIKNHIVYANIQDFHDELLSEIRKELEDHSTSPREGNQDVLECTNEACKKSGEADKSCQRCMTFISILTKYHVQKADLDKENLIKKTPTELPDSKLFRDAFSNIKKSYDEWHKKPDSAQELPCIFKFYMNKQKQCALPDASAMLNLINKCKLFPDKFKGITEPVKKLMEVRNEHAHSHNYGDQYSEEEAKRVLETIIRSLEKLKKIAGGEFSCIRDIESLKDADVSYTIQNVDDVIEGLAVNYYHGYLKLILPGSCDEDSKDEDSNSAFPGLVVSYEQENDCALASNKLLILCPESCYTPKSFTFEDDNIEHVGNLGSLKITRAGQVGREYGNQSVYKFFEGETEKHAVMEGAATLLMLYEHYRDFKHLVKHNAAWNFCQKVNKLLQNGGRLQHCILWPYADQSASDKPVQLNKVIADAIKHGTHLIISVANSVTESRGRSSTAEGKKHAVRNQSTKSTGKGKRSPAEKLTEHGKLGLAMALSYFYGFLNIVLKDGFTKESIDEFRKSEQKRGEPTNGGIRTEFIMILPEDANVFSNLSEVDGSLEAAGTLPSRKLCRGGRKEREYGCRTVYKFSYYGKFYRVVAEYPANILLFTELSTIGPEQKREHMKEFGEQLKMLLNVPHIRSSHWKILYFPDSSDRSASDPESGRTKTLAETIGDALNLPKDEYIAP